MENHEEQIKTILSEIKASEAKAFRKSWLFTIIAILIGVVWLSFSYITAKKLDNQIEDKRQELSTLSNELERMKKELGEKEKVIEAARETAAITQPLTQVAPDTLLASSIDRRKEITVRYFTKDVDRNKVIGALENLGFNIDMAESQLRDSVTNCIWFGSDVNREDVRLVAYALANAGVSLQDIRPFRNSTAKKNFIEIGARERARNQPVLTAERIKTISNFIGTGAADDDPDR